MPYYVPDNDRELAEKLVKTNVCAECGRRLYVYLDMSKPAHPLYVGCSTNGHTGIEKVYQPTRFQEEGLDSLTLKAREETMSEEHGKKTSTALTKSGMPLSGALTKSQAMEILRLVYPDVPDTQIVRTAILCKDFGLHPLMKEVYIIPFGQGEKRTWSTVLGINATRKMMARMGSFSYIDNTPRVMTIEEQELIYGETADDRIRAITKLRTKGGLEAQGYGHWMNKDTPYGIDKGNTKANMAFIRSERQGFSRLFPDAIPQELEVIDEAYVEGVGAVDKKTGEVIDAESKVKKEKAESSLETPVSPELEEQTAESTQGKTEPDKKDESSITKEQADELQTLLTKANMSGKDLWKACKDSGWTITKIGDLKVWQFEDLKARIEKGMGEQPPLLQ